MARRKGRRSKARARSRSRLLDELSGYRRRRAHRTVDAATGYGGGSTHIHFECQALPNRTQRKKSPEPNHQGDAPAASPRIRRTGRASTLAAALGGGEGSGGVALAANIMGPDLDQIVRILAEGARRHAAASRASSEARIGLSVVQPRGPRGSRSAASRRPRRADVDHRQHAAPRPSSGEDDISFSQGRPGTVSGEDAGPREPAARPRRRSAGSPCRLHQRPGPDRQHRARRARPRAERAESLRPAVQRSSCRPTSRPDTRSTKRRTSCAPCSRISTCHPRCRSG